MSPSLENYNPIPMRNAGHGVRREQVVLVGLSRRFVLTFCLGLLLWLPALGQAAAGAASPVDPLPQDTGAAGLKQMLLRLHTTARLMQTTAHPDDEDGGMLTLESRGKGVTALLLTLNRGEGGQNKVGSNLFDVLGVLRTLELTASDRYYGVEQRFTRVADFGYSKSAEETFQKWGGHDIPLGDMVRVIRTFRPDVLVARFSGTDRDGHGHHQASSILTREAFRAAADPNRFPEQIKEGLPPWQAKKLYVGNVCGFMAATCPAENYTVKLATGEMNPALGMTYMQFAINEGLRHQLSQGAGGWSVDAGPHYSYYKLVESVLPPTTGKDGHEQDFFDGIHTSLPGLTARLGEEEKKVPSLRPGLERIANKIQEATEAADKDSSRAAGPLFGVVEAFRQLADRVDKSNMSEPAKLDLLTRLRDKAQQAETALNLAMNVSAEAIVVPPKGPGTGLPHEQNALTVVSPGQRFTVTVEFHNGSKYPLMIEDVSLDGFTSWITDAYKGAMEPIKPGEDYGVNFRMQVPARVSYTRPYWHRSNPEQESINTVDQAQYETLPFPPSPFHARLKYSITGRKDFSYSMWGDAPLQIKGTAGQGAQISVPVVVPFVDDKGTEQKRALAVAPAFSVMLEPGTQTIRVEGDSGCDVTVGVSYNLSTPAKGNLRLEVPPNWRVEPSDLPVEFHQRGEKQDFHFRLFPASLKEGRAEVRAVLDAAGTKYSEGYTLVTREDLDSFYYYQPAIQRVSIVDVQVPRELKVGYIMGAGDDIPMVLKQIGMDITLIPAERLASENLSRYGTIVLGIRAYDTQKDVTANNKKLLDYVSAGGTLIVQYNTAVGDFNNGHFTPYPAQLSRARVSVEEAPVEILAPDDGVFHYPNQITPHDFDGWVQERGLYFMDQWDSKFKPLLSCHDPGEQAQRGGLLQAQYGKGTYIYTGYAFFRQLPAGVPGAIRLYVNLLSAGHEKRRVSD
ncbi:MAG TPA: PIG-L family deacetylase [Terriglobales bacterium]|nr:PIG-L family deacetylase [Terriglobales bacterium]